MEEIKVNDFVRLARNQGINKIIYIDDECHNYHLDTEIADEWGDTAYSIRKEDLGEEVLKHSPNIIDLIEKDDYINGCRVYKVEEHGVTVYQQTEDGVIDYNWICRSGIKSIVTHEQFNSMKYRLE